MIKQALTEGKMQRKGDGEEIRNYVHVKDAAQACIDLLDDKYKNEYFIISGSQTIKVKELLSMIKHYVIIQKQMIFWGGNHNLIWVNI